MTPSRSSTRKFGRILGYTRDEIEGKKKWMEFVVPEDIRSRNEVHDPGNPCGAKEPINLEVTGSSGGTGTSRNALLTITRVPGTQKLVVAIMDITDKIRAETAIQMANRKLNFFNRDHPPRYPQPAHGAERKPWDSPGKPTDPHQGIVLDKEIAATDAIQALITFTRECPDIGNEPGVAGRERSDHEVLHRGPFRGYRFLR